MPTRSEGRDPPHVNGVPHPLRQGCATWENRPSPSQAVPAKGFFCRPGRKDLRTFLAVFIGRATWGRDWPPGLHNSSGGACRPVPKRAVPHRFRPAAPRCRAPAESWRAWASGTASCSVRKDSRRPACRPGAPAARLAIVGRRHGVIIMAASADTENTGQHYSYSRDLHTPLLYVRGGQEGNKCAAAGQEEESGQSRRSVSVLIVGGKLGTRQAGRGSLPIFRSKVRRKPWKARRWRRD